MNKKTKAWTRLICLAIGSGSAVTITTHLGGSKLWIAILAGIGTGLTNVYHALGESPQQTNKPNPQI